MRKYSSKTKRELLRMVEEQNHSIGITAEKPAVEKPVAKRIILSNYMTCF